MTAEPFTTRPGAARGLEAKPFLASGAVAYQADIASIAYTVTNLTDGGSPVTGTLTVADVMFAALQTTSSSLRGGHSFHWDAPGTLWPTASKQYHIDVHFTDDDGLIYKHAWLATTEER